MKISTPHYLLYSESNSISYRSPHGGTWRFVLRKDDGTPLMSASEEEPGTRGERLELLSVVRGLEALNQPSKVTLVTPSRSVHQGLRFRLEQWRANGWRWESFGRLVPIKNQDLWLRIDRALGFHDVRCVRWRIDNSHCESKEFKPAGHEANRWRSVTAAVRGDRAGRTGRRLLVQLGQLVASVIPSHGHALSWQKS